VIYCSLIHCIYIGTPKRIVKCLDYIPKGEDDEAVNYFVDHLPRLKAANPDIDMTLFLQRPGETVFVPGGWWHAVLNLEDSIAVTQNYCSSANFGRVWIRTKKGRKKMAVKWRKLLEEKRPDLARVADMWDSMEVKK
jgi:histone arginine demethylase JMJD6